jgi:hypothetical protein
MENIGGRITSNKYSYGDQIKDENIAGHEARMEDK